MWEWEASFFLEYVSWVPSKQGHGEYRNAIRFLKPVSRARTAEASLLVVQLSTLWLCQNSY